MLIVDRIEGGFAVCEDDQLVMHNIPLDLLPESVREGSVIRERRGRYTLDAGETAKRRERLGRLRNKLFEEGKNEK